MPYSIRDCNTVRLPVLGDGKDFILGTGESFWQHQIPSWMNRKLPGENSWIIDDYVAEDS